MPTSQELYNEAEKLKDEGKLEEACAKLTQVLEEDAKYALAHSALAVIRGKLGEHEQAIKHALQVCELEPKDAFSFTALSVTYQRAFAGTGNQAFIQQAEDAMARAQMLQGR